jgi:hypothetical protein
MTERRDVTKRILVIANDTAEEPALHEVIRRCSRGAEAEVLVVASVPIPRARGWFRDDDGARMATRASLEACVARLVAAGIRARGLVADADPLRAASDVLFAADEIVLATRKRPRRPSRNLVERVRKRFAGPIFHVVVDPVPSPERRPAAQPVPLIPRLSERR